MKLVTALLLLAWWLSALGVSIYGLYLAFSASVILGIIAMFVEPSPFILGLVALFFHRNLAQEIVNWLSR